VKIVEPDDDWMERYDRLYRGVYSRLAPTLSPVHDALAAFRHRSVDQGKQSHAPQ
jgi:hypothetical protein